MTIGRYLLCAVLLAAAHATMHGAPAQSSGSVSGVVTSADTPAQPLRRATVSLISSDLRVPLTSITGDDGRFTFENVAPGHYSVVASKPAYVGAFYGSKRPGRGPGVPVAVRAGGRATDLRLALVRGGVIAGSLRLPSGQPAHNMPVSAVEVETVNGVRRLRLTGGRTTTDDRGQYRIFGLPPGQYVVIARPSGLLTGAIAGANDTPQTSAAEVSWAQQMARSAAGEIAAGPPPERGPTMNYAPVFFPGTTDASAAAPVEVGASEEHGGIDFALALVATARVSGIVLAVDGRPLPNVPVSIAAEDDRLHLTGLIAPRAAVTAGADGSFSIPAVAPGRYLLSARAAGANAATGNADSWARQAVVVDGRELSNVALQMQPGLSVSGRLLFESTGAAPAADELVRARVFLTPISSGGIGDEVVNAAQASSASVGADGSFVVSGLTPGRYRASASVPGMRPLAGGPAAGWSLLAITSGSEDVSDRALDIRAGEASRELVVRFTDRPTEFEGRLLDATNRPAPGYPIVVFSTNRGDWIAGSRRVAVARPSTDGTFRLIGLPAGTYFVAAVVSIDAHDLDDPAFLEQLAAAALRVTLKPQETNVQNLRIGGGR